MPKPSAPCKHVPKLPLSDREVPPVRCVSSSQSEAKAAEGEFNTANDRAKELQKQLDEAKAKAAELRRKAAEKSHKAEDAEEEAESRLQAATKAVRLYGMLLKHSVDRR